MIYVISPGRSGTGWLAVALYTAGFDVVHEIFTYGIHGLKPKPPLVYLDTTLVFEYYKLIDELTEEDRVILLERDSKEVEEAVATLLPGCDCTPVLEAYRWLSVASFPCPSLHLHYDTLFNPSTAQALATFLSVSETKLKNVWKFLRDFRITNQDMERKARKLYDQIRDERAGTTDNEEIL